VDDEMTETKPYAGLSIWVFIILIAITLLIAGLGPPIIITYVAVAGLMGLEGLIVITFLLSQRTVRLINFSRMDANDDPSDYSEQAYLIDPNLESTRLALKYASLGSENSRKTIARLIRQILIRKYDNDLSTLRNDEPSGTDSLRKELESTVYPYTLGWEPKNDLRAIEYLKSVDRIVQSVQQE
jgi:hypothetical protein